MLSNLSSVGFPVHTQEQFQTLANKVMPESMAVPAANGRYLHWRADNGAELWVQADASGKVVSLTPHFAGKARLPVSIVQRIPRTDGTELDGSFFAWAAPGEQPDSGEFPFVFDVPDYRTQDELELPAKRDVQITAFTQELQIYDSPAAYDEFQRDDPKLSSRDVLPIGLFTPQGDPVDPPQAKVVLTGHIQEAKKLTNPITQAEFHWAQVETVGGTVDVLIDPEFVSDEIPADGVLSGTFWLSGRVL